jgi:hypothetical protein
MGKGQQAGQGLISRCPPAPSPPSWAARRRVRAHDAAVSAWSPGAGSRRRGPAGRRRRPAQQPPGSRARSEGQVSVPVGPNGSADSTSPPVMRRAATRRAQPKMEVVARENHRSHRACPGCARAVPRPRAALTSPSSEPSPSPLLEAWVGPAGALRGHRLAASASPWTSWATASTMIILVACRVACRVARRVVRRVADRVADRVVSAAARNSMKHEVKALGRGWLACRLLPLETLRRARPGTGEVAERSRGGAAQESKRRRAGE